jgi:hypothetical protein
VTVAGPHGFRVDPATGDVYGPRKKLKPYPTNCGYVRVAAYHNGEQKKYSVHRVVWEAVNGPIPDGMVINHLNGVKTDNRIGNLEMVTPSENTIHAFRTGLRVPVRGHFKLTEDDVRAIRRDYKRGVVTLKMLGDRYGVCEKNVHYIVKGETWAGVV